MKATSTISLPWRNKQRERMTDKREPPVSRLAALFYSCGRKMEAYRFIKIVPDSIDCSLRPCAIFNNLPVLKKQVIIAAFFNQLRVMGDNKLRFSGFGQRIDVLRNTLHISICCCIPLSHISNSTAIFPVWSRRHSAFYTPAIPCCQSRPPI